jgi:two-component system, NtrC family, sensor kinase
MPVDFHGSSPRPAPDRSAPSRPSAAKWTPPLSLRTLLPILVAVVVAAVLTTATYAEVRSFARVVENELVQTADRTARAVVDDLLVRGGPELDPIDVHDTLNELIEANAALHALSVLDVGPLGTQIVASTSSEEREESLALGRQAVVTGAMQTERNAQRTVVALPVVRNGRHLAVIAAVSMAGANQVRTRGSQILLWFSIPTIVLVTMLIDVAMRRLIHQPIGELRRTISRVSAGNLASRAAVLRRDELGTVAAGLNEMLVRLDHANDVLQQRVEDATSELRVRNAELETSYQRTLALREALTEAERMAAVGQMAASVAHQVGTPLNLVSGYVQMICEDRQTDASVRQRLQIVETQLSQVTNILRSMLDQARRPGPRVPVKVSAMVERVCAIARPRLARSNVALLVDAPDSLGVVHADAPQLELALLSLVTNALDAMPSGGTLTIRAAKTAAGVRLAISDTGHGIPPALLPHLFDAGVTTKPPGHGTGLGLAIVREVVHQHGGQICAANGPESGATFAIDLPVFAADAPGVPAARGSQ